MGRFISYLYLSIFCAINRSEVVTAGLIIVREVDVIGLAVVVIFLDFSSQPGIRTPHRTGYLSQ
jgi:hypothetical protein